MENNNQPGLTTKVNKIEEKIDKLCDISNISEEKKLKLFRLKFPRNIKRNMKKIWKKNKIPVFYLGNNNIIQPVIGELREGNVIVGDKHHDGSKEFVWLWRGKIPIMIIPEWDIYPIGTKQYHEAQKAGRLTNHQTVTIRAIKMAQQMELGKKRMKSSAIILMGVGAVIVGYLLFSNMGG